MNIKPLLFSIALLFVFNSINAQAGNSQKKVLSHKGAAVNKASFNGAWQNDKGFSVMYDGYFNSVAQDSSGKWGDVHAGTYTVNGDKTITFKVLYSSHPERIGSSNTAEYTFSGNTVKLRHFKKLVDGNGRDLTDQMPKDAYETMTRMK